MACSPFSAYSSALSVFALSATAAKYPTRLPMAESDKKKTTAVIKSICIYRDGQVKKIDTADPGKQSVRKTRGPTALAGT